MKRLLTLLMIAFAAVACQDDPGKELDSPKKTVEIIAEDDQTRTQMNESGFGSIWDANETIGVIGKSGTVYPFTTSNDEPAPRTTFSGEIDIDDEPAYAYDPSTETTVEGTTLSLEIPSTQIQSGDKAQIAAFDMKVGVPVKGANGNYSCSFTPLVSRIRFDIDATYSEFQTATLVSLKFYSPNYNDLKGIAGKIHVDIANGNKATFEETGAASAIVLKFDENNRPTMKPNKEFRCWITANPTIKANTTLLVELTAINKKGKQISKTFKFTASKDYQRGYAYVFKMKIPQLEVYEKEDNPNAANKMLGFSLLAANNSGKIFAKEIRYNPSGTFNFSNKKGESGNTSQPYPIEGYTFEVDEENKAVKGCVPYLYNFNLAPTFEVSEGAKVYVKGVEQVSGQTVNDFSQPVEYTIVSEDGYERTYTVNITNSGLPVVVLEATTSGNQTWQEAGVKIYNKEYEWEGTEGHISIYNADGTVHLDNALAGYRLRGNSSMRMPKKPFAIKFDSKQSIFGMPKHKRWCLLANWTDRAMIRNAIAMEVAHATDEATGMGWNPHGVHVEVVYGDIHVGNYFLCEQVKIDGDRVDIQDPYGDVLEDYTKGKRTDAPSFENCGYLMEFACALPNSSNKTGYEYLDENYFFITGSRNLGVMFKDDFDDSENGQAILKQVESRINTIEKTISEKNDDTAYTAAKELMNMESFVDWWIVHELMMNNEYKHPKSAYIHMDGNGKLVAGPCWDFDYQTLPNPAKIKELFGATIDPSLTKFLHETPNVNQDYKVLTQEAYLYGSHLWYATNKGNKTRYGLFEHAEFKALVKQRWNAIYGKLSAVINRIDELGAENAVSAEYNNAMWPQVVGLNDFKKRWSGQMGDENMTYEETIENLKYVYRTRLEWMNSKINSF